MIWRNSYRVAAALACGLALSSATGYAETPEESGPSPAVEKVIEEYCVAVSDAASERRAAKQALALKDLRASVEERIARLEQAKTDLESVIKRQEELRNLANQELVGIYAGMAPEIAASQMEKIGSSLAASVLRQLKPRQASAILNEMKPDNAAQLVKIIASVSQNGKGRK